VITANNITLLRIVLIPLLLVFMVPDHVVDRWIALAIFLLASATDWLDGYVARSRGQVTNLGKLLDPVADKLLIAASLISLVQVGRVPAWMVVLIVCRDLAITGLRAIAASQNLIIQASDFGKATMTTEVIAVALMILSWPPAAVTLGQAVLLIAIALSLVSGFLYFQRFWRSIDLAK